MPRNPISFLTQSRVGRHWGFPPVPAQPGGTPPTPPPAEGDPILPRAMPKAAMPTSFGTEWFVNDHASFLNALNNSVIGDLITVDHTAARIQNAVATSYMFPVKSGAGPGAFVTIRTDAWASLPGLSASGFAPGFAGHAASGIAAVPGTLSVANNPRVTVAHASLLAKFRAPAASSQPVGPTPWLRMMPGSGGLYLWGLDVDCAPDATSTFSLGGIIRFGELSPNLFSDSPPDGLGWNALTDVPHDVVLQQCYIHSNADTTLGNYANYHSCTKAVYMSADRCAVVNSTLVAEHTTSGDANALYIAGGVGPYVVDNCLVAGTGENFLIGGGGLPSWMTDMVPSDITFTRNHFYKPDVWLKNSPGWAGKQYPTKNPFELKYGKYFLLEGNLFDGNVNNGQNGQGVTIKTVNQNEDTPWSETAHVTMRYNRTRRTGSGLVFSCLESGPCSGGGGIPVHDVLCHDNITDLSAVGYGGDNRFLFLSAGCIYATRSAVAANLHFRNETFIGQATFGLTSSFLTGPIQFLELDSCVFAFAATSNHYGFKGDATGEGTVAFNLCSDPATRTVARCVFTARPSGSYPAGNFFPATDAASGLNADGSLAVGSPLLAGGAMQGRNGLDNGANLTLIAAATAGVDLES